MSLHLPDSMERELQYLFSRYSFSYLLDEIKKRYDTWSTLRKFANELPTDLKYRLHSILDGDLKEGSDHE